MITGSSPFSPAYQSVSGDISLTPSGVASIAGNTTSGNDITAAIVNFATSNKTGSGSVVLASSPTLVAPIMSSPTLGTITSGNGAALTALNASNISSGILAAANGGAGTVNGILKSNGSGNVAQAVAGTDYLAAITLTTTGTGAATLSGSALNIPKRTATGANPGGIPYTTSIHPVLTSATDYWCPTSSQSLNINTTTNQTTFVPVSSTPSMTIYNNSGSTVTASLYTVTFALGSTTPILGSTPILTVTAANGASTAGTASAPVAAGTYLTITVPAGATAGPVGLTFSCD